MEFDQKSKPGKLTSDNLEKLSQVKLNEEGPMDLKSQVAKKSVKSQKNKKQKPAWAVTEKMQEEEKEKEIDELIEFAYDLDYEKYLEDYEVRQALAVIKERIQEIKQDEDWKTKEDKR
jgi:hypothetical protein